MLRYGPDMKAKILKRFETEIQTLDRELKHDLPKEIQRAREHGDLRENAEYQAAKERQRLVEARISLLQARVSEIALMNLDHLPHDRIALGSSVGGFLSISATITNWFNKKRALAQGLFMTGMGIGGLLVPLLAIAITTYGWRAVAFASGIIIIVFNMPAAMSLRHKPEPFGYMPDGEINTNSDNKIAIAYDDANDLSAVQAMKTSTFWLIGLGHAFSLLVVGSVGIHFTPHVAQKLNYSLEKAGLMISVLMVFTIIGQTVGGYLGDKIDKRLFLVFTMIGHSSGLLVLTFAQNDFHVVMFCLLHGLAWGSRGPSMQSLRAEYFGRRSFATIMGFSSILNALAMAIAPISAGILGDYYGDYTVAFVSLAIMTGFGSLFFALLKPPIKN